MKLYIAHATFRFLAAHACVVPMRIHVCLLIAPSLDIIGFALLVDWPPGEVSMLVMHINICCLIVRVLLYLAGSPKSMATTGAIMRILLTSAEGCRDAATALAYGTEYFI